MTSFPYLLSETCTIWIDILEIHFFGPTIPFFSEKSYLCPHKYKPKAMRSVILTPLNSNKLKPFPILCSGINQLFQQSLFHAQLQKSPTLRNGIFVSLLSQLLIFRIEFHGGIKELEFDLAICKRIV